MEPLIRELYKPSNQASPERVNEIQRQIQRLQREKTAWQAGIDLLQHGEAILRFYGALTLTIKINTDWWDTMAFFAGSLLILVLGIRMT
jgi:hypothetical protein